jgi:hypothetical protein
MTIDRPEAVDLLRKWESERTLLRCDVVRPAMTARLRGRIVSVGDVFFLLESDDGLSEIDARFAAVKAFLYVDGRDVPAREAFEGTLICVFDIAETDGAPHDSISLAEINV